MINHSLIKCQLCDEHFQQGTSYASHVEKKHPDYFINPLTCNLDKKESKK